MKRCGFMDGSMGSDKTCICTLGVTIRGPHAHECGRGIGVTLPHFFNFQNSTPFVMVSRFAAPPPP